MNRPIIPEQLQDIATEWLVRLQSDDLTEQDKQTFNQWLQADSSHQLAYIETEKFWASLSILEQQPESTGKPADNLSPAVRDAAPRSRSFIPTAIAACFALFVIGFVVFTNLFVPGNRYVTAVGEQTDIVLQDGTRMQLNTATAVRTDLDEQRRLIYLDQGEVFFQVAKDSERPFIVKTSAGLVRVLGTQFNVLNKKDNSSIVTVMEGRVGLTADAQITQATEPAFEPGLTLIANQQAVMASHRIIEPVSVDAKAITAWRDGTLIYNGEPIDKVLEDISRYFDGEIRLGEPDLAATEVVAIFQLQDKEATIKALEEAFNVAAVTVSEELTLLYPKK